MNESILRELTRDPSEGYYLSAFSKLEQNGKNTWNWGAFFGGTRWFNYRKMYWLGWIYCLTEILLVNIISTTSDNKKVMLSLCLLCLLSVSFVLGMCGNRIYYRQVKKDIAEGYHLCEDYRPASPFLLICALVPFLGALITFRGHIRDRKRLREKLKENASFDKSANEENIKALLALKKEDYYMKKFKEIQSGKIISLNGWSFVSTPWICYKRMFLGGLIFGIMFLVIDSFFIPLESAKGSLSKFFIENSVVLLLDTVLRAFLVLGGANRLYYRHIKKKYKKIQQTSDSCSSV